MMMIGDTVLLLPCNPTPEQPTLSLSLARSCQWSTSHLVLPLLYAACCLAAGVGSLLLPFSLFFASSLLLPSSRVVIVADGC